MPEKDGLDTIRASAMARRDQQVGDQLALFDRDVYLRRRRLLQAAQARHSPRYQAWWCSPRHDRQKYEALVRQKFRCDHCGYLLNPRYYDLHHAHGYANLGYEEASELVAVHRRCHRVLEDLARRDSCGCTAA